VANCYEFSMYHSQSILVYRLAIFVSSLLAWSMHGRRRIAFGVLIRCLDMEADNSREEMPVFLPPR
jgi:hypothetical protein